MKNQKIKYIVINQFYETDDESDIGYSIFNDLKTALDYEKEIFEKNNTIEKGYLSIQTCTIEIEITPELIEDYPTLDAWVDDHLLDFLFDDFGTKISQYGDWD